MNGAQRIQRTLYLALLLFLRPEPSRENGGSFLAGRPAFCLVWGFPRGCLRRIFERPSSEVRCPQYALHVRSPTFHVAATITLNSLMLEDGCHYTLRVV